MKFRAVLPFVLVVIAPLAAAQRKAPPAPPAADVASTFYQAFWFDRGDRDGPRALRLYQQFLERAPEHALAPDAARFALNLLRQLERGPEADAFEKQHATLLASSVKPGINAPFLDPTLKVEDFEQKFEVESREIFLHRAKLAALVGLGEGQAVADIGAGTGLFTWPFARRVGERGRVYAVEIAPPFVAHLRALARNRRLPQVEVVRCTEKSVMLEPASVDVAFVCDTYHHFEFPKDTMASIHRALRPDGTLVLIDFERIEGKSRPWVLGHVRAGKDVVIREVESFGFRLVEEVETPLKENYFLRFRRAAQVR